MTYYLEYTPWYLIRVDRNGEGSELFGIGARDKLPSCGYAAGPDLLSAHLVGACKDRSSTLRLHACTTSYHKTDLKLAVAFRVEEGAIHFKNAPSCKWCMCAGVRDRRDEGRRRWVG